jgi:glucose/mannose-6-phosphate isomerase
MANLDAPEIYQRFDPSNMIGRIGELPQQCLKAWQGAIDLALPPDYADVDKVIIIGVGGSAIGGDLVRTLTMTQQSKATVLVHRDYNLPQLVDERTLVIASSYSGDTEETLSAFSQALQTTAKKLAITTGGRLKTLCLEKGIPVFTFHYKAEPRVAFGYSFFSLLAFFKKLGLITIEPQDVDETVRVLEKIVLNLDKSILLEANRAKQLAVRLPGRLVTIYGAGILSKVAFRWKTQLNECSKVWAFAEYFPELNHNAIVGYRYPAWINQKAFVIMLRSALLHPRILIRYEITADLLNDAGVDHEVVEAKGESPLSQMMSAVLFGDYVSYYLALLNGVNPSPVAAIDYMKERLAKAEM